MDTYSSEAEWNNDPQKCFLTVIAPCGTSCRIRKSLQPLLEWIDPALLMIQIRDSTTIDHPETIHDSAVTQVSLSIKKSKVVDNSTTIHDLTQASVPYFDHKNLSTPYLAVVLFLAERGDFSCKRIRHYFLDNRSWKLHHSIELTHKWSETLAGQQDFYSLFDHSPLWCVNETYGKPEVLRFTIFVKNFTPMVEFYRIVTETEMESQKPGFGVFPLYQQPGLRIELCLKHHKRLIPHTVPNAYLTFKIRNIEILKQTLGVTLSEIKSHGYRTVDPDGNTVVLCDISPTYQPPVTSALSANITENTFDVISDKSTCDNHDRDSGRFSDSDLCDSDAAASVERLNWLKHMSRGHHSGRFSDSVEYPKDNNGWDTPTKRVASNRLCKNSQSCDGYGTDLSQDSPITTPGSTCMCNTSNQVVNSLEGWIDGIFKDKPLFKTNQSPKHPTVQTTCPDITGFSDRINMTKHKQTSESSHFRQTFEKEMEVTTDCKTVDKMFTRCAAINQHQCSQILDSQHSTEKHIQDEEVHSQRTSRRKNCFQKPVLI